MKSAPPSAAPRLAREDARCTPRLSSSSRTDAANENQHLFEPESKKEDANLTPEEKNFLDYLVKQALRSVLDKDAAPEPDMTPHKKDET